MSLGVGVILPWKKCFKDMSNILHEKKPSSLSSDKCSWRVLISPIKLLPFFLFIYVFFPTFPAYTKGEMYFGVFITFAMLSCFSLLVLYWSFDLRKSVFLLSGLVFFLFLALTLLAIILDIDRVIFSDFVELLKPIAAFLAFLSGYSMLKSKEQVARYVASPMACIFIVAAIMGIGEATLGFDSLTNILYTKPRAVLEGKATAPFGVTYFYATFMLLGCAFFLFRWLSGGKAGLVLFFLSSFALLLSQSRTVFIGYVFFIFFISTVYFFAYKGFPGKKRIIALVLFFFISSLITILFYFDQLVGNFSYLYSGLKYVIERGVDPDLEKGSANIRAFQLLWALENNVTYGFLGSGIGKGYSPSLESFYSLYIYRYGFFGIFLYVMVGVVFFVVSFRISRQVASERDSDAFSFFMMMHVFVMVLPIVSLSSVITDQFAFIYFYYGFMGISFKFYFLAKEGGRFKLLSSKKVSA